MGEREIYQGARSAREGMDKMKAGEQLRAMWTGWRGGIGRGGAKMGDAAAGEERGWERKRRAHCAGRDGQT